MANTLTWVEFTKQLRVGDKFTVKSSVTDRSPWYCQVILVGTEDFLFKRGEGDNVSWSMNPPEHSDCRRYLYEITNREIKPKTIMSKLNSFMRRLLDKDVQKLVEAGLINGDLKLTSEGVETLDAILLDQNKAALVAAAEEIIKERKETK